MNSTVNARNRCFTSLANPLRCRIVTLLEGRDGAIDERNLAAELVAVEQEKARCNVTDSAVDRLHVSLRHVHLPTLAEAGLVAWDQETEAVTSTVHSQLEDPVRTFVLETAAAGRADLLDALAHERRRVVLAVLEDTDGRVTREELARAVATRETESDDAPERAIVERVASSLHHVHLPKLASVGSIEYEPGTGTIVTKDVEWATEGWDDRSDGASPGSQGGAYVTGESPGDLFAALST